MLRVAMQKKTTQKRQLLGSQGRNKSQANPISFNTIPCRLTVNNRKMRQYASGFCWQVRILWRVFYR